jgi:hypothetical protein
MAIFKFGENDLLYNQIKVNPRSSFYIYDSVIYNNQTFPSSTLPMYSFITKNGSLSSFSTISDEEFNSDFIYGDQLTGSSHLLLSSSLRRNYYATNESRIYITSLRNTLDYYKPLSEHYSYSSSHGLKSTQELNLITIPSIFYGSSIKKGTVNLKHWNSGTLVGELRDINQNGELVQVGPSGSIGSGSIAGVCLYREGFVILTGTWDLTSVAQDYLDDNTDLRNGSWVHFGAGIESDFSSGILPSSSFLLEFSGSSVVPTITMFCNANYGRLNHSNNPTYIEFGQEMNHHSSSNAYVQRSDHRIKNIHKTDYDDPTGSFRKITYISSVNIYDEDKNIIAVAKMARPIKKTEDRDLTIKLKLDI